MALWGWCSSFMCHNFPPKIYSFISASQRSSLGMCKRCGNLKLIACSNCKDSGLLRQGGAFSFDPLDEISSVG